VNYRVAPSPRLSYMSEPVEREFEDSAHRVFAALVQVVAAAGTVLAIEDFGTAMTFMPLKSLQIPRALRATVSAHDVGACLRITSTRGDGSRWELYADVVRGQNVCDAVSAHLQRWPHRGLPAVAV
jgi:hypothetical protein